jgi:hypothetical protein
MGDMGRRKEYFKKMLWKRLSIWTPGGLLLVFLINLAIEAEGYGRDEPSCLAYGSGLDVPKVVVSGLEYLHAVSGCF